MKYKITKTNHKNEIMGWLGPGHYVFSLYCHEHTVESSIITVNTPSTVQLASLDLWISALRLRLYLVSQSVTSDPMAMSNIPCIRSHGTHLMAHILHPMHHHMYSIIQHLIFHSQLRVCFSACFAVIFPL